MKLFLVLAAAGCLAILSTLSHATPISVVGNGDEGGDLEGANRIEDGPFEEVRKATLERARSLNVRGIPGLGNLENEIEKSTFYMAGKDVPAVLTADQGRYHAGIDGNVFARTFARPGSETRFFPIAKTLSRDQLLALQTHEALHRALPESVREDEAVVSALTLAIVSPEASHDRVRETAVKMIPEARPETTRPFTTLDGRLYPEGAERPSSFAYTYRSFFAKDAASTVDLQAKRMHTISSVLYPLGDHNSVFGLGIEMSLVEREGLDGGFGPLKLSGQYRVWTVRGFDVLLTGSATLNTLSEEELRNSAIGRDSFTAGMMIQKSSEPFYLSSEVNYTIATTSEQKIGTVTYEHSYGWILGTQVRFGFMSGALQAGGRIGLDLGDNYSVSGGAFRFDSGRYRIVSGGPEVLLKYKTWGVGASASWLLSATRNATLDYLGNLATYGTGQGSLAATVQFYF